MPQITIELSEYDLKHLLYISRLMKTQDCLGTADPVYIVYDRRKMACPEENAEGSMWLSGDGELYSEEDIRAKVTESDHYDQNDKLIDHDMAASMRPFEIADAMDMTEFCYKKVDVFRGLYLTRASADAEIIEQSYRYEDPYVFVGSAHDNTELQLIRRIALSV